MIDADVTELIARVPLPAGADMLEVVLRELERIFLEDSGLAEARPGVRVSVSRPAHYLELLENIQVHGYHVMRGRGRVLENAEIAADWYDAIYTPTLAAIDRLRLGRLYRDAPPGDLFLVLHRHRRDAFPSTGCPHLAQTVVSVIGDDARRRRWLRLPGRGTRTPAFNMIHRLPSATPCGPVSRRLLANADRVLRWDAAQPLVLQDRQSSGHCHRVAVWRLVKVLDRPLEPGSQTLELHR